MQFKINEVLLDEDSVGVRDTVEKGSAIITLLFRDSISFDDEGVAMKITRDTVYLTVNGLDEADDIIKCQWSMNRLELIRMLIAVEGN